MKEEQIYILIHKYLSGEATDSEKELLLSWINSSEENKKLFSGYKKLLDSAYPPQPPEKFNVQKGWEKLSAAVGFSLDKTENVYPIEAKKTKKRNLWLYVAAASIIIVAINLTLFRFFDNTEDLIVVKTKAGQRLKVELPDHSIAYMNAASELCYSGNNDLSEREVLLKGEAYFSVDHDNRSFTVRTKNAAIKVLGTKFNVKSRRNKTSVYVKKGVVSVRNMLGDSTKKVILHKNESSACVDSQPPLKPVVVDSTLVPGWMENKFVFHKTSIREIIEELQYSFGKKIVLKDGDLGKLTVTGVFEQQDIESILSSICLTLNLEYSLSSGTYYIFSKK